MKKILLLTVFIAALITSSPAQEISIDKGWKFAIGDSTEWASPAYNDNGWKAVDLKRPWEAQGYKGVDGFGWYRLHLVIPSSIKEKSYLKDSLRFTLNDVDDNDEVYLNGKLVAKYGGKQGTIKDGNYGLRSYTIAANNPALLWDKENVLAIRIFDTGGEGGLYGDKFTIAMAGIMDPVTINTDSEFSFGENNSLDKAIKLTTTSSYLYKGKLAFKVTDSENGTVIYDKTNNVDFTAGKPFTYKFNIARLEKKSYLVSYTFTEEKSGESITKTDGTPYILTPYPSAKPMINGPDVYGARPGNPF